MKVAYTPEETYYDDGSGVIVVETQDSCLKVSSPEEYEPNVWGLEWKEAEHVPDEVHFAYQAKLVKKSDLKDYGFRVHGGRFYLTAAGSCTVEMDQESKEVISVYMEDSKLPEWQSTNHPYKNSDRVFRFDEYLIHDDFKIGRLIEKRIIAGQLECQGEYLEVNYRDLRPLRSGTEVRVLESGLFCKYVQGMPHWQLGGVKTLVKGDVISHNTGFEIVDGTRRIYPNEILRNPRPTLHLRKGKYYIEVAPYLYWESGEGWVVDEINSQIPFDRDLYMKIIDGVAQDELVPELIKALRFAREDQIPELIDIIIQRLR